MDPERWGQIEAMLADAMAQPAAERAAFLAHRCGDDAELRAEVESLILASRKGEAWFDGLKDRLGDLAPPPAAAPNRPSGRAGASAAWASLHDVIGDRYRLESLIDEGGMGLVFLAVDRRHDRRVAIKTIHPGLEGDFAARFEREIRIMAGLQHPNILPLLDSGIAGETLFYIMPYVEGESLKQRLDRVGRLSPGEAVRIALDVADGLAHAHKRGVLHRDIKPGNILLTEGHVQLVDFGIARAIVEVGEADLTMTGAGIGTPNYMAPEQFVGRSTPRSDVYSLGAVLYESLTGRIWKTEASDGEPSWKYVPRGLLPVLTRAVADRPSDRWAEISELAGALAEWSRIHGAIDVGAPAAPRTSVLTRLRRLLRRRPRSGIDGKSIAVLPFDNLNRDDATEYFSEGITEDIIAHLSRIRELKVISRTSVMRYRGSDASIPRIARELGVRNVLEGSVRRLDDRVRVVAQLVDARTDEHLWSETFDRELTDIFEIQSDVAQRIAQALRARITDTERSLIRRRPTEDVEAHDLYLKGRHLWSRRTQVALEGAEEQFQRAIARDPLFAPAYAGLADVYLLQAGYGYRPELEGLHKARTAVHRALELDESLAEAHASKGQILRADRDWAAEEREYQRAIQLNPNYATAHQWHATLLAALGRGEEAAREIGVALELDPLSHAIRVTSGILRFTARDYEGALADFERTLELEPRFFSTQAWLLLLWCHRGEYDSAMKAWEGLRELHPDPRLAHYSKSYVLACRGDREGALAVLREGGASDPGWTALVRARLGDIDEAFDLLEGFIDDPSWRLFVLQRSLLFYIRVGPWFDPLRDDPRFEGLLRRMNMAD